MNSENKEGPLLYVVFDSTIEGFNNTSLNSNTNPPRVLLFVRDEDTPNAFKRIIWYYVAQRVRYKGGETPGLVWSEDKMWMVDPCDEPYWKFYYSEEAFLNDYGWLLFTT